MEAFKSCLFVAFVFIHQSHSLLCFFLTKTKSTKNTIKTVLTYYFTVTKSMTTLQLNAEIYEALMSEEAFFTTVDQSSKMLFRVEFKR